MQQWYGPAWRHQPSSAASSERHLACAAAQLEAATDARAASGASVRGLTSPCWPRKRSQLDLVSVARVSTSSRLSAALAMCPNSGQSHLRALDLQECLRGLDARPACQVCPARRRVRQRPKATLPRRVLDARGCTSCAKLALGACRLLCLA